MKILIRDVNPEINDLDLVNRFLSVYIKSYALELFNKKVDHQKLDLINQEFDINSYELLTEAINSLLIKKVDLTTYELVFNNKKLYKNFNISYWVDLITRGNLKIKGYPIIRNIFTFISDNIGDLYQRYTGG